MIRILQCVNNMHRAGLETMLMNYYRHIDRDRIQFDFLTHRPEKSDYDDEIIRMGGRVYYAPRLYPQNYPSYFKYMKDFFVQHPEYKIIHSHIDSMSYFPLLAAKRSGGPIRIAHSHSTSIDKDLKYLLKQYFRSQINTVANVRVACGENAGRFLFGNKDFKIIHNAIDADKFRYNEPLRQQKRKELSLEDAFVIGHVGRFNYPKNHEFLVRVFSGVVRQKPNARLLLVGCGEKEQEIRALVSALGLQDSVLFLGNRADVDELYQAMDLFVLPSRFEGIPLVGVEAQFSGLNCLFSDRVPKEVAFTDQCTFIELSEEKWMEALLGDFSPRERFFFENAAYDIRHARKTLEEMYQQLYLTTK